MRTNSGKRPRPKVYPLCDTCVEEGLITKAVIYSDALDCGLVEELSATLHGHPFRKDAMVNRIGRIAADTPERKAFIEDITGWLNTKAI